MSADLESVIAGVLAWHWSFSTDTDDYPRFVDRCDGCHEIVFNHGREDNQNQSYAAHQARAVLAALGEAGGVEWGVQYQTHIEPVVRTYHSKAIALAMLEDDDSEALVFRITGPWTAVEE